MSSEGCYLGRAAVVAVFVVPFASEQAVSALIAPDKPVDSAVAAYYVVAAGDADSAGPDAVVASAVDETECSAEHEHLPASEQSVGA